MTITLVLNHEISREIENATRNPLEIAGVLLVRVVPTPANDIILLGLKMNWVPQDAYLKQKHDQLSIASHGYVPALSEAEVAGATCLWFHTHPGETAAPVQSEADIEVDKQISDVFRLRSGSPYYGTAIFSPRPKGYSFTGTLMNEAAITDRIDRLWCVGDEWRLLRSYDSDQTEIPAIFDRNVKAFGPIIQGTLGDLRIAIVGCGGTGSAIAEQLVRLGIRHLSLFDADRLSSSNVTRVYGSTSRDVHELKAEILKRHLTAIAPDLKVTVFPSMITNEVTARNLIGHDLVFGCTDDNAGRLILSRFSSYFLTPIIDVGVMLSSDDDGSLIGIDGRVTILSAGSGCLVCRGRIDVARAAAELMTPEEQQRLAAEGYAPALGGVEPAVVAFTTAVAASAINELLERLIGYGPTPRPGEVLLRLHEREISTNIRAPRDGHYCHPDSKKIGLGITSPFLEQAWTK